MEIVFSAYEKGIINRAKCEGLIGTVNHSKELLSNTFSIAGALDIGSICSSPIGEQRKKVVRDIFNSDQWEPGLKPETEKEFNRFWNEYVIDYCRMLDLAQTGESVRIWYSHSPESLCGYLHITHMLSEINCSISTVRLPAYSTTEPYVPLISWGQIYPENIPRYFFEKTLSLSDKESVSTLWKRLKEENAPLRASVNGHLISVQEDFYDSFIFETMGCMPIRISRLIVKLLRKYPLGVSDYIVSRRLKRLISRMEVMVLQREERFYDWLVQRT